MDPNINILTEKLPLVGIAVKNALFILLSYYKYLVLRYV